VREKLQTLQSLMTYMDTELYSSVKLDEPLPFEGSTPATRRSKSAAPDRGRKSSSGHDSYESADANNNHHHYSSRASGNSLSLLHIMDFHKLSDAFVMLLGDGSCQINFSQSRSKMILPAVDDCGESSLQAFFVTAQQRVYGFRASTPSAVERYAHCDMASEEFAQTHLQLFKDRLLEYYEVASKRLAHMGGSTDC